MGSFKQMINFLESPEHRHIHTAVLSSEGFCRADSIKHELSLLAEKWKVTVVACVRDPLVWANSLMNQLVKMRLFFSADVDLEALAEEMVLRDFSYSNRLQLWSDVLGRDSISVIGLEEGNDFVGAFFDTLGIDSRMLPNAPPRDSTNKSLGLGALQIIHWIFRQNIALENSRKAVLNQRFHDLSEIQLPNLLNQRIRDKIGSRRLQVIEELSRDWLDGKRCFLAEPKLPVFGDFRVLDSPDIGALAEKTLSDDPDLLSKLREAF